MDGKSPCSESISPVVSTPKNHQITPVSCSVEHAMSFLANPWKIWNNSDYALKKTVLRLAFAEPLPYRQNQGLRTPNLALPFKVLGQFCSQKCEMARPKGFEPLTPRFVVWCSIQLSYGCRYASIVPRPGAMQAGCSGKELMT